METIVKRRSCIQKKEVPRTNIVVWKDGKWFVKTEDDKTIFYHTPAYDFSELESAEEYCNSLK